MFNMGKSGINLQTSPSSPQNRPHTNYSRQRSIAIKPRFKSSIKFKKNIGRFFDKKQLVDFMIVKELDEETGLYYYGARYLDPRTSRWLTGDPAIYQGDYIPVAPINDDARKHNQNLPGMGGIFNIVNMHAYHYAGNNPVKYVDPDGRETTVLVMRDGLFAAHVATHFSNPLQGSNPALYDPGGHYLPPVESNGHREQPGSGRLFRQSSASNLMNYIRAKLVHQFTDDYVATYTFTNTTPEQESRLINRADELGGGWATCARRVSTLLDELGLEYARTPGGVEKQMERLYRSGAVSKSVYTRTREGNHFIILRTDYTYDRRTRTETSEVNEVARIPIPND